MPPDGDQGAGVAARHLVVDALVREDVVGGDLARLGDDEAVGEFRVVGGEPERAGPRLATSQRVTVPQPPRKRPATSTQ